MVGADRTVWCGPRNDCAEDELIAFVEDLLLRHEGQLAGLYLRLG